MKRRLDFALLAGVLVLTSAWLATARVRAADDGTNVTTLPPPFHALGSRCKPAKTGRRPMAGETYCSDVRRIVGVYGTAEQIPNPSRTAVVLSEPRSFASRDTSFVALAGDWLWVRRVTCGRCRVILGWSFIGDVASLSDGQLLALQKALGFAGDVPALRTADAWRAQPMPSLAPPR